METTTPTVARRIAIAGVLTSINMRADWVASNAHAEIDSEKLSRGMRLTELTVGRERCSGEDVRGTRELSKLLQTASE
jgi:hypothetical protein